MYERTETTDYIKSLRDQTGMTQTAFAQALGVAPHTLHKWETGERPRPHLLNRLERIEAALRDRDRTDWTNLVGMNRKGNALNARIRHEGGQTMLQMGRVYDGLFVPEGELTLPTELLSTAIASARKSASKRGVGRG